MMSANEAEATLVAAIRKVQRSGFGVSPNIWLTDRDGNVLTVDPRTCRDRVDRGDL